MSHELTALYERLSHDDELQGKNNSISNQRKTFVKGNFSLEKLPLVARLLTARKIGIV